MLIGRQKAAIGKVIAAMETDHLKGRHQRQRLLSGFFATRDKCLDCVYLLRSSLLSVIDEGLGASERELKRLYDELPPYQKGDWPRRQWQDFEAGSAEPIVPVALGEMVDERNPDIRIPWPIPVFGRNETIVILSKDSEPANQLLHSLIVRLVGMLGDDLRLTLLDPYGQGRAFAFSKTLSSLFRRPSSDGSNILQDVADEIARITREYLDETDSFWNLPISSRQAERVELVVVANFPNCFCRSSIDLLKAIGRNGPRTGKCLIVHAVGARNELIEGPLKGFESIHSIDLANLPKVSGYRTVLAPPPPKKLQEEILAAVARSSTRGAPLLFEDHLGLPKELRWQEDATERLRLRIGVAGNREPIDILFGVDEGNRPCAHAIIGATTGAGKSSLIVTLILGLVQRYSKDELCFYLLDGKDGVSMSKFRHLPHVKVLVLNALPEIAREVLSQLLREMERRNALFVQVGVTDYTEYRKLPDSPPLPRIILIIDEYRFLLDDDNENLASIQILQLVQQARSAGISVVLCSQGFGLSGIRNRNEILQNIQIRLAMSLPDTDSADIFGCEGRNLITRCDAQGDFVLNCQGGRDGHNQFGRSFYACTAEADRAIDEIVSDARTTGCEVPRVFDGKAQPSIIETTPVSRLLSQASRPSKREWTDLAHASCEEGGLGEVDGSDSEPERALWLGQDFSVYDYTNLVLRRQPLENVLIVGGGSSARLGLIVGALASLGLTYEPDAIHIDLFRPARSTASDNGSINLVVSQLLFPAGIAVSITSESNQFESRLVTLVDDLDRRKTSVDSANTTTRFVFILAADKVQEFQRITGKFDTHTDSDCGALLRRLYTEGPVHGIHVILEFSLYSLMMRVLNKKGVEQFKHRVVLQISEEESISLTGTRQASQLQKHGQEPIVGLSMNSIEATRKRFKPYSADSTPKLSTQIHQIAKTIRKWRNEEANPFNKKT